MTGPAAAEQPVHATGAPFVSANLDEFGNTALQPGGLLAMDPLSRWAQAAKYWLSGLGLRDAFCQSLTMVGMSDTASGERSLQFYTASFLGNWATFEIPMGGPADCSIRLIILTPTAMRTTARASSSMAPL